MAEKKIITKTRIPNLIHLVEVHGKVFYLVLNERNNLSLHEQWTDENDQIYKPKQDIPIRLLNQDIVKTPRNKDYKKLLEDVISFIKRYLEMPHPVDYLIIALWIFHTYAMEKFDVTPYLYLYGSKEVGKSRASAIINELAFFCMYITSPTEASLFRSTTYYDPTIIIDEIAMWGSEEAGNTVAQLIKSRYKRGLSVPRVNLSKPGEDSLEFYVPFGPLVLATTEEVPEIIESRCLTFLMQKNINPAVEIKIDGGEAASLRNRLTCFRADIFNQEMPEVTTTARRRLKEITEPLYQMLIIIDGDKMREFNDFVNLEEVRKQTEDRSSFEAQLVFKVTEWYSTGNRDFMSTEEITISMNVGKREREYYSLTKIGMAMKKIGFEKAQKDAKRGYTIEINLLRKLAGQYGFPVNDIADSTSSNLSNLSEL